jgi:hypothetical protein
VSAPEIVFAIYDGTQVSVRWIAPTGGGVVAKYLVGVTSSNGGPPFQQSFDPALRNGNVPVPGGFGAQYYYSCTVGAMMDQGPTQFSNPVPLITTTPQVDGIVYDGTEIATTWRPMTAVTPTIESYTVRAIPLAGGNVIEVQVAGAGAHQAIIVLQAPLVTGSAWQVVVFANAALGASAASPKFDLITYLPSWGHALYRGTMLAANWLMLSVPPPGKISGFGIEVVPVLPGPSYQASFANPDIRAGTIDFTAPLLAWRDYGLRVLAYPTSGRIPSAATPRLAMLVGRPTLTAMSGSNTAATATWRQVPQPQARVGGYTLVASSSGGGQVYSAAVPDPQQTTATITFNPPLPDALAYQLEVHATGENSAYESSSDPVPILRTAPTGLTNTYDGSVLQCTWAAVAGAAGYTVTVTDGSAVIASAVVGTTEAAIAAALLSIEPYTVNVSVGTAGFVGPPVTGTVITAAPVIASVTYDPSAGTTVTWTALTSPTKATGYAIQVLRGAEPVGDPVPVSGLGTNTFTIAGARDAFQHFAVVMWATAAGAAGPRSNVVSVLTAPSELSSVVYDGTKLALAWQAQADERITGYEVALTTAGNTVAYQTVVPSLVLPGALGAAPAIMVRPIGNFTKGPPGASVTAIIAAPTLASPVFDGQSLSVTVTPPAGVAGLTGYDQVLLRNGQAIQRLTSPAPAAGHPLILPVNVEIDPAASYALQVSARVNVAAGPVASAVVLLAAPVVESIVAGTGLTVTVVPGPLSTSGLSLQAVLYTDGVAGTPQTVGGDGKTNFTLPTGTRFAIAARGLASGATGPWSTQVPALTVAPTIASAHYGAGQLAVSWSGNAAGRFAVAVTAAGNAVTQTLVEGEAALLSFASAGGTAYTLKVTEIAGVASGPPAALALVTDGCAVLSAATDANRNVTVSWTAPAAPTITQVQPVLLWGATTTALGAQPASTNPLVVALPPSVPNGASIAVRAIAGIAVGPIGNAGAVLTMAPSGLALTYDGQNIKATWDPAPDGTVSGYVATLLVSGQQPVAKPTTQPQAVIAYTPTVQSPLATATVAVSCTAGIGTGPANTPVPVIAAAPPIPGIVTATFDGTTLALTWNAVNDSHVKGYLISLLSSGTVTRQVAMGGTSGAFGVIPGDYAVQAQAYGDQTVGPACAPVTLITAAPAVTSAAFDPVAGSCLVSWAERTGATQATQYRLMVFNGPSVVVDQIVPAPATSYTLLANTFQEDGDYTCTVSAAVKIATQTVTGPTSPPFALIAAPPSGVSVAYNGAQVTVGWNAVALAGVTGYRVSAVASGIATRLGETSATGGVFALTPDPNKSFGIVVQAMNGPNVGAASAAVALTPRALFLSASTAVTPYIAPASGYVTSGANAQIPATDIDLYLPNIFATAPQPADLPSTPPFFMTQASGVPPFAYKLTMAAASPAWTFTTDPIRKSLIDIYKTFLSTLQDLTATPAGINLVREAIARTMPQSFAELPYYAYGASFDGGYVDLRPGMVVRAEFESYQTYPPQTPSSQYLPGFVTTAVAEYEVSSYVSQGSWLAGLDAFLANMAAARGINIRPGIPIPPDPTGRTFGGGGVIDAFYTQFQQPFCRLVYPPDILQNNSIGSAYPYDNPVLIAASVLRDIEAATARLRNKQLPDGNSVAYFYIRGRTTFTVLIRVIVNGAPRLVPVGTTVGNLLAVAGVAPLTTGLVLDSLTMTRSRGGAILDPSVAQSGYAVGNAWIVRLNWSPGFAYNSITDWLALPLLHGDEIAWTGA